MKKCPILTVSITVKKDRIWAVDREESNQIDGKKEQGKFAEKVMVWLAVCSEGIVLSVVFGKGTLDHHRYIKEVLPVAL